MTSEMEEYIVKIEKTTRELIGTLNTIITILKEQNNKIEQVLVKNNQDYLKESLDKAIKAKALELDIEQITNGFNKLKVTKNKKRTTEFKFVNKDNFELQ